MKQLTAVEKYALQHIETIQKTWKETQLKAADDEIEAQKREFDAKKLEEMTEALGTVSSTPTEGGSVASESDSDEENSSTEDDDDSDDEESNSSSSDEEEDESQSDSDDDNDDQDNQVNMGNPLSPRTRSRGDVRINLWNLDK